MIKSMTGFSKFEAEENGLVAGVELKSLNGRGLDFNFKMPRTLNSIEVELRKIIRSVVARGNVSIYINFDKTEGEIGFHINNNAASEIHNALLGMKKHLNIRDAVKIEHVLQFSNQFTGKSHENDDEVESKLVIKALKSALLELDKMRKKEGSNIARDIIKRIKLIHKTVKQLEVLGMDRIPVEREKYRKKIALLFENDEVDETRLQTEIVMMADKLDISEEVVRLYSHLKEFNDAMKLKEAVGRKLNFLLQEMNREVNTIGSKANNTKISHLVVNTKEELERVREQVQNIE